MKASKYKDLHISPKNWISERLTSVSLSCRFIILFSFACLFGIYIENNANCSVDHIINGYFSSFYCSNVIEFIKSVCLSSSSELFVLLAAMCSALTFFCSAFLHLLCIICGSAYGACVGAIANTNIPDQNVSIGLYIFSVTAFAIIYSISASFILSANNRFISEKRNNAISKTFVSPALKQYLIGCFRIIAVFALVRILYTGALAIVQII